MDNRSVQVLMATYNGERFLEEQIDSIMNQSYSNISLLIRDDCSNDKTNYMIQNYLDKFDNIYKLNENSKNLGAKGSFFELLVNAHTADYYALADQDDYWMPDKIHRAVEKLQELESSYGMDLPLLYCSAKIIAEENLDDIYLETVHNPRITFGNSLVENLCTGCTCVMNKRLRDLLIQNRPKYMIMHDWWIYMTAISFGAVYYDEESRIKYRQHGNNVYGEITSRTALLKYRLKELLRERGETYRQIEEFCSLYKLSTENKKLAQKLINSKYNIKLRFQILMEHEIFRQKKKDNRIVRLLILLGKL